MSGGSYEYLSYKLEEASISIRRRDDHQAERKILSDLLIKLSGIMHEVEWYDSGDSGEEVWVKVNRILARLFKKFKIDVEKIKKIEKYEMIKFLVKEK